MDESKYDQEYEYDEYREVGVTSVGLPPGQMALIIGVNAVISLVIAISVVLLANRQVLPGDLATSAAETPETVAQGSQHDVSTTPSVDPVQEEALPDSTPLQSVSYVVEDGDTLGLIADKFSVSISDLMIANGLSNQDLIQIGQELTIPLAGVSTATPTFTPMLIPTETPLPFDPPTPLPADAEIPREPAATVGPSPTPTPTSIPTSTPPPFDEINVTISEVTGAGDLVRETLVILNKGAGTSLRDWKLEGSSLGVFIFPDIFLFSGGSIRVHTAAGENTPSDLYLNQGEPAWPPGTTIILNDAGNAEMSKYVVP
jgi:LysM repeat protein